MAHVFFDGDDLLNSFDAAHTRFPDFGHPAGGDLFEQDVLAELDTVGRFLVFRMRGRYGGGKDRLRDRHPLELRELNSNRLVGSGGGLRGRGWTRGGGGGGGGRRGGGGGRGRFPPGRTPGAFFAGAGGVPGTRV